MAESSDKAELIQSATTIAGNRKLRGPIIALFLLWLLLPLLRDLREASDEIARVGFVAAIGYFVIAGGYICTLLIADLVQRLRAPPLMRALLHPTPRFDFPPPRAENP